MVARLVVAAPSSGAGKTTVATGLMAALRARGLEVSPHKTGPDYIDPGYHALATGRPGRNLDPVLVGEERIAPLLLHGARGADVAVVEGAMGLFDGRGATDEGSTAHVARLLEAPVVLVVDAAAQSRSVAALVTGFAAFDPRVRLGGVVLNRVGSDRHEALLREALDGVAPVLGVLRRDAGVVTPSRHLGLVPAAERAPDAVATVRRLGEVCERSLDVDALLALARSAPPLGAQPWSPPVVERSARPRVAVAGGAAFTFSYAETVELLEAAGAEVVVVDPLRDPHLPDGTAGLVLGGGFPEVYAAQLSANEALRADVRALALSGAPVHAECAGLLYLCEDLDGAAMCGVLPAHARMGERLVMGYRETADGVRGHEHHRTVVAPRAGEVPAWTLDGGPEGFRQDGVVASYLHVHWAGTPEAAAAFVDAAARQAVPA
ncbi:MAG TPA: cobyrinate a,c-diamide synthase [Mycobacteriales bacterium]|nr:cobyrinate a,c-diamide synthase [Mycobacteriales bacterium]